jgi:retinol dehydrogenase 12
MSNIKFAEFLRDQRTTLPLPSASEIVGRTFVVTGANSGLGYECVKHLVNLGAARVILGVRTPSKGEAAVTRIEKSIRQPGKTKTKLEVWQVDLSSFDSIEAFAKRLQTLDRVDALVNNGGLELDRWEAAEGDIEMTLAVNVIGCLLMVCRALPALAATAKKFGVLTRISVIASTMIMVFGEGVFDRYGDGNIFDTLNKKEAMTDER